MVPSIHPRNLPEGYAARAVDADLSRGVLEAFRTDVRVQDAPAGTQAWLHSAGCRVGLPCDASVTEDTVGCGQVFATGVSPYPTRATITQWAVGFTTRLGLPMPTTAPDVAWATINIEPEGGTVRAFAYAYINEFDEPGPLSPPSMLTTVNWDTGAVVGGFVEPAAEYRATEVVVYVLQPGVANMAGTPAADEAKWYELGRVPLTPGATFTYSATRPLGQTRLDISDLPPPTDLRDIQCWGADVLAGLSGDELMFSTPGQFGSWPDRYRMRMHDKPLRFLAGQTFGYVLTCGSPEVVRLRHDGSRGGAREVTTINEPLPLVGPLAATVYDGACFYASTTGIVMLSGPKARVITEGLMTQEQWEALQPFAMTMVVHQGWLIASSPVQTIRLKVPTDIHAPPEPGSLTYLSLRASSFFRRGGELYYVAQAGGLYWWQRGAERKPYTYVTRKASGPGRAPAVWLVDADGPEVDLEVWLADEPMYTGPATPGTVRRLRRGMRGGTIQLVLTGTATVTEVAVDTSAGELAR